MSRDNRKDHRYFVFVKAQKEEDALRTHLDDWLLKSFPKALVQSTTVYPIRVDSVNAEAVLDPSTGYIHSDLPESISKENGNLRVGRIGWLSQPGKKYGSIVLYLKEKSQADVLLARGFLEVGGESGTTQAWEDRGKAEQRCFNCQKQGHLARTCKETTTCGNCAQVGHYHKDCISTTPKCSRCGGNHRAKDHKEISTPIPPAQQTALATNPQPEPSTSQLPFPPPGSVLFPSTIVDGSKSATIFTAKGISDSSEMSHA